MCRGSLHLQLEGTVLRGSRAGQHCGSRNHPSCVCMCEGGGRGGEGRGRAIGPKNAIGEWARRRKGE
jgi:hypothetical protein